MLSYRFGIAGPAAAPYPGRQRGLGVRGGPDGGGWRVSSLAEASWRPEDVADPARAAALAAPLASRAFRAASGEVRAKVGRLSWALLYPVWRELTREDVLAILLRVSIEAGAAHARPWLGPSLGAAVELLRALGVPPAVGFSAYVGAAHSLVTAPAAELSPAARAALDAMRDPDPDTPTLYLAPPDPEDEPRG